MFKRYTESNKKILSEHKHYFAKRNYGIPIFMLVAIFTIAFISVLFLIDLLAHPDNILLLLIPVALIFIALTTWIALSINSTNDLIMATEFQNLIFASAAKSNTWFCLIVRDDGSLIYADRNFTHNFITNDNSHERDIDILLDSGLLTKEQQEGVLKLLKDKFEDEIYFDITTKEEYANQQLSMDCISVDFNKSLDGLSNNFFVIRGIKKKLV
jgi:hypothetical protein